MLDAIHVTEPTMSKHWRENVTLHGLAHPKLTWGLPTLSLTTKGSWLPWGRVAMPLISPLMPVPNACLHTQSTNVWWVTSTFLSLPAWQCCMLCWWLLTVDIKARTDSTELPNRSKLVSIQYDHLQCERNENINQKNQV